MICNRWSLLINFRSQYSLQCGISASFVGECKPADRMLFQQRAAVACCETWDAWDESLTGNRASGQVTGTGGLILASHNSHNSLTGPNPIKFSPRIHPRPPVTFAPAAAVLLPCDKLCLASQLFKKLNAQEAWSGRWHLEDISAHPRWPGNITCTDTLVQRKQQGCLLNLWALWPYRRKSCIASLGNVRKTATISTHGEASLPY